MLVIAGLVVIWQKYSIMLHKFCVLLFGLALVAGCGGPDPQTPQTKSQLPAPILKFHWAGKNRIAAEAQTTNFMAIWNLPESARLETQTLDKLATAPWRLMTTNAVVSTAPTNLLRPLLDDLVQQEVYVEIIGTTNQPVELVLAIRLPAARVPLWETNLPQVLQSWSVAPAQLKISRSDDWTLLAFTPAPTSGEIRREPPATLLAAFGARIAETRNPHANRRTNLLMALEMDLVLVEKFLGLSSPLSPVVPRLSLTTTLEGDTVRTVGEALLSDPIASLPDWRLPTNSMHDPLIAFSATRGLGAMIAKLQETNSFFGVAVPDQFFSWAVAGYPLQTYFAAPQLESTNAIRSLAGALQDKATGAIGYKLPGRFVPATNHERIDFQGIPFMEPWLKKSESANGEFLVGGLIPMIRTNRPIPDALIAQVVASPNLIYYDWEITGPRVESWVYISQTLRLIFNRQQLPPDSAGLKWLHALMPRVGNSATAVTLQAPQRVTFTRTATVGFTGLELHLLTDWLESPRFPWGLHTEQAQLKQNRPPLPGK